MAVYYRFGWLLVVVLSMGVVLCAGCAALDPPTPARTPGRSQAAAPTPQLAGQAAAQPQPAAQPGPQPAPQSAPRSPGKTGPDHSLDSCKNTPPDLLVDRSGCPIPIYLRISLPYVSDDALYQPQVLEKLETVAKLLSKNATAKAIIEAHADAVPNAEAMTLRRAETLKWYLTSKYSAPGERIDALGLGSSKPLVSNDTQDGRERNRRVDILVKGYYGRTPAPETPGTPSALPAAPETTKTKAPPATPTTAPKPATGPAGDLSLPAANLAAGPLRIHYSRWGIDVDQTYNQHLEAVGRYLEAHPEATASIDAYTDANGSAWENLRVSQERGERVKYLLLRGFDLSPERIAVTGHGKSSFLDENKTEEGRWKNRRVEISLNAPAKQQTLAAAQPATQTAPEGAASAEAESYKLASPAPGVAKPRVARRNLDSALSVLQSQAERDAKPVAKLKPATERAETQEAPAPRNGRYAIEVSVNQCKLWFYEVGTDGKKRLVSEYNVATAKRGISYPTGTGHVTAIDFHPSWTPTASTLRDALRKGKRLPRYVPPGSRSNPMGEFKIYLSHGDAYRIHGTNAPDKIGQRVSRGCIRMHNSDGLQIAKRIGVGAEVTIRD